MATYLSEVLYLPWAHASKPMTNDTDESHSTPLSQAASASEPKPKATRAWAVTEASTEHVSQARYYCCTPKCQDKKRYACVAAVWASCDDKGQEGFFAFLHLFVRAFLGIPFFPCCSCPRDNPAQPPPRASEGGADRAAFHPEETRGRGRKRTGAQKNHRRHAKLWQSYIHMSTAVEAS